MRRLVCEGALLAGLLVAPGVFAESYVGLKGGLLATSPGTNGNQLGAYALAGYHGDKSATGKYHGYYGVEFEAGTTLRHDRWSGRSLGVFGTYRNGTVTDALYVKTRLGLVQNRTSLASQQSTKTSLGAGLGLGGRFGERLTLECEINFGTGKVVGPDELAVFSLGLIYSF